MATSNSGALSRASHVVLQAHTCAALGGRGRVWRLPSMQKSLWARSYQSVKRCFFAAMLSCLQRDKVAAAHVAATLGSTLTALDRTRGRSGGVSSNLTAGKKSARLIGF